MLPRADQFKEVIFIPRIIAFNESFVPVGPPPNNRAAQVKLLAVIWHDAISGRKVIVSEFYAFFRKTHDSKCITIWLDNCASQNKNWALFSFSVYIVNTCSEVRVEGLEVKYLEAGHIFVSADLFHHQVELSTSRKKKIYYFSDFSSAVKAANSSKTEIFEMEGTDFLELKEYKSDTLTSRPLTDDFVSVLFEKGKNYLQFKTGYTDDYQELQYSAATVQKNVVLKPKNKVRLRRITQERKVNLITKLKPIIPTNRLDIWESLTVTNNDEDLDDD